MISSRFAQFFLISIRFAKGHSLHHMLRGSAEGVVCANNGHLIRRYYQAAHFCQTNSRLFVHWKTFRTSSNQPSFAAEIHLGAHYDNINFFNFPQKTKTLYLFFTIRSIMTEKLTLHWNDFKNITISEFGRLRLRGDRMLRNAS